MFGWLLVFLEIKIEVRNYNTLVESHLCA